MKCCFATALIALFSLSAIGQTAVEINNGSGCGNALTSRIPAKYDSWTSNYSWSSMIYQSADIGIAGDIVSLSFFVDDCFSPDVFNPANNQKIYLAHTTENAFSNTLRPDNDAQYLDFTLVFNGSVTWAQGGWNKITFDLPFSYNGTDNLMVFYTNEHGGDLTGGGAFSTTGFIWNHLGANRGKYKNTSGSALPGNGGFLTNVLPIVKLDINENVGLYAELERFKVTKEGRNYRFDWSLLSEVDNDFFSMFYAYDNTTWEKIAQVPSYGNTPDRSVYSLEKELPITANKSCYFMLTATDIDGNEEVLSVRHHLNTLSNNVKYFPNPVQDQLTITSPLFETLINQEITVKVFNAYAAEVYSKVCTSHSNALTLDLSGLSEGIYYVQYATENEQRNERFVITKTKD